MILECVRMSEDMDKAVMRFLDICLKCEEYDNGRCPTYNLQMDGVVQNNKEPHCDKII